MQNHKAIIFIGIRNALAKINSSKIIRIMSSITIKQSLISRFFNMLNVINDDVNHFVFKSAHSFIEYTQTNIYVLANTRVLYLPFFGGKCLSERGRH